MGFYNANGGGGDAGEVEILRIEFKNSGGTTKYNTGSHIEGGDAILTITDDIRNKYQYVKLISKKGDASITRIGNTIMEIGSSYAIGNNTQIIAGIYNVGAFTYGGGATIEFHN